VEKVPLPANGLYVGTRNVVSKIGTAVAEKTTTFGKKTATATKSIASGTGKQIKRLFARTAQKEESFSGVEECDNTVAIEEN
jgi:hypothetical protein